MTISTRIPFFRSMYCLARGAGIALTCAVVLFSGISGAAADDGQNGALVPADVKAGIDALLAARGADAVVPGKPELAAFLDFAMSPLASPGGEKVLLPARPEGSGAFWKSTINAPLATTMRYLYDPKIPTQMVLPASIRRQYWLADTAFYTLKPGLWAQLGKHNDTPLVVRGKEYEEITPDTFSGSYYNYMIDRLFILTAHAGQQVLISVSWQGGKSSGGKKAVPIGDYQNWDFVYSGAPGTLAKGIGWADTYMYDSASIIVLYEDAPGGSQTKYSMFKWLNAGWANMNMVKEHHIIDGAKRSFAGMKAFLESPKRPPADEMSAYVSSLQALDSAELQKRFAPYAVRVEAAAADTPPLRTDDFQNVIKDGAYAKKLSKDEIIAAMSVNFVKQKLGMQLLAGPLE